MIKTLGYILLGIGFCMEFFPFLARLRGTLKPEKLENEVGTNNPAS